MKPLAQKITPPLMEVKEGFGYMGTLLYDEVEDKVQCHVCGELFTKLYPHILRHNLKVREYKDKFSINYTTGLCTPTHSQEVSQRMTNLRRLSFTKMTPDEVHNLLVKAAKLGGEARRKNAKEGRNRYSIEMMNRTGACPLQIEERFARMIEEMGHTPTWRETERYDAQLLSLLVRRFKGYNKALNHFGLRENRITKGVYGLKEVEGLVTKFVKDTKRIPSEYDCRSSYLPSKETLRRYFGSWKKARKFALKTLERSYPLEADKYDHNLKRVFI